MRCMLAAVAVSMLSTAAVADVLEREREAYVRVCSKCHGLVTETPAAARAGRVLPAVMSPLGPNLTGVFGRPAGTVAGYRYSNAFRAKAGGWVWDAETLDPWLANSQAVVRGSYMFLKTEPADRALVIDYLRRAAPYRE